MRPPILVHIGIAFSFTSGVLVRCRWSALVRVSESGGFGGGSPYNGAVIPPSEASTPLHSPSVGGGRDKLTRVSTAPVSLVSPGDPGMMVRCTSTHHAASAPSLQHAVRPPPPLLGPS